MNEEGQVDESGAGETVTLTGGCQCGAVRFAAANVSRDGYWCHCRMCQRAVGNVAAAFINVARADVSWTSEPVYFASSPIAKRGFCAKCGTPLTFDYPDSNRMDLCVGALDDPAAVRPTSHFGVETRVPGWVAMDDLPAQRCDDYAPLAARWASVENRS